MKIKIWPLLVAILCSCGGPIGPPGLQGPPGMPGNPGTIIIPIPLCPDFIPTYPNVFPEYALCIDNQLYGVYSRNGGFLALLPPGTYYSDGINASCTLVVESNCVVTGT